MKKQAVVYYGSFALQKLAVITLVGWTVVHWIITIDVTTTVGTVDSIGAKFDDPEQVNDMIERAIEFTSYGALQAFITALLLTLARLLIPRVRKFDKNWVILDIVILAFCMLSVIFSHVIVRASLLQIGY